MKVFYWSPHISHVATVTAVINSAYALSKYSDNKINSTIINSIGEWDSYKDDLKKQKIDIFDIYKKEKFKNLPRYGFIKSRISYWIIFLHSFLPLKRLLDNQKPDYLIIHLITSLPIILNFLFNFESKIILRISGYPKLNFLRKCLWKLVGKKLHKVVCPTEATCKYLIDNNIFEKNKVTVLKDPIINISRINFLKRKNISENFLYKEKYLLSIGRITKQKNFFFLVKCFQKIFIKYPHYKLVIIGEGELQADLIKYIRKLNLGNKIFLIPFKENIFSYLYNCECFILSSLWEDPGFVLIEAGAVGKSIISSDCPNGPMEFLSNGEGGFIYQSNNVKDMENAFDQFVNSNEIVLKKKKIKTKKKVKEYSLYSHYLNLKKLII